MVTLVRAAREVSNPARRDQQFAGARDNIPAPVRQAVLAERTIHVAQVAASHAPHDDGGLDECGPHQAIGWRELQLVLKNLPPNARCVSFTVIGNRRSVRA
jgi:hypothetical protein